MKKFFNTLLVLFLAMLMMFVSIPCYKGFSRPRTYSNKVSSIYRVGNGRGASRSQRW